MLLIQQIEKEVIRMNINLKIFLVGVCIVFIVCIYLRVLHKKLDHKSALALIPMIIVLMLLCIFDQVLIPIRDFLGFEVTSNMIFLLGFVFVSIQGAKFRFMP